MTAAQREALRARSSALFGNRHLAEVVIAIADLDSQGKSRLTVRMLATHTDLPDNLVRPVAKRLVEAGLLDSEPQQRPRGPSYHQIRSTEGAWHALVRTCTLLS